MLAAMVAVMAAYSFGKRFGMRCLGKLGIRDTHCDSPECE